MKVLILITKSNLGGAQRYVYDLSTNLAKNSYEVEVMAGGKGLLIEKLIQAGIKADGELPITRDVSVFGDIKVFFKLISILRKKRPDILHVNSSKMGGLGALAGRLVGIKKIIFTAHGWAFNEDRTFISKMIIKFLHWITIVLSHQTIAVSGALQNQLINWPWIDNKITIVHNGIEAKSVFSKINARYELSKIVPSISEIIKSDKNLTIIGSVGELHKIKGYEYAIRAVHGLIENLKVKGIDKKIVYLIISTGEEKDNLEKLIKDLKMESNIFLLGYVVDAYQYLKAFDIFLLPSISEGLPYIGLEAGLASLPIISTAVGGIPEMIGDMKSGILIQPKKSDEIRFALEFYLTHKAVRNQHGVELHKRIINDFTIESMIKGTIDVYSKSN